MGLVEYSGSEGESDTPQAKPATKPTKASINRLVDVANPSKIKVSLPQASTPANNDEPPAKRQRTAGSGLGGFNAMLPAPKRTGDAPKQAQERATAPVRRGPGVGVSLKTGSEPAFSRAAIEPDLEHKPLEGQDHEASGVNMNSDGPLESIAGPQDDAPVMSSTKSTIFRPLSVARKPQKKKPPKHPTDLGSSIAISTTRPTSTAAEAKRSIFSIGETDESPSAPKAASSTSVYEPMLYTTNPQDPSPNPYLDSPDPSADPHPPQPPGPQTLSSIADDLSLPPSARRQLLGKHHSQPSQSQSEPQPAIAKVLNFNTDAEYNSNEALRQSGAIVQHNQVRALAAGKHSLKQLVNAVGSQREALEESFAQGRRRRGEAGGKYGW